MNRVDIARFEFDYDTTWSAFFTDSKLRIYSRYGGRDEHEPEARLSKASLLQTMREVLEAHRSARALAAGGAEAVPPAASIWHPEPKSSTTPLDIPLLKKNHQGCVHCHQVREYSLLQAYHDQRFNRELLFTFPLPESLGIEIDRTHGHRVLRVRDGSPAADAELKTGDVVIRCADVPIRSELDLRWALHRLPQISDRVTLLVERQPGSPMAQTIEAPLSLPSGWRHSELSWRKSSRSVPSDWGFRAAALAKFERRDAGLPETGLAIRVLSIKPRGLAQSLGFQKGDVITALGDDTRERTLERLRSDMLRRFAPGDEVRLTILRGETTLELRGKFPAWFTEETTVP
jgi:serine protease Do